MIAAHARFIEAIEQYRKLSVRFYSQPDRSMIDRVCAPLDYGPGNAVADGVNRYWLWDYAGTASPHLLGLQTEEILDLQVLGENFDPTEFGVPAWNWSIPRGPGPLP